MTTNTISLHSIRAGIVLWQRRRGVEKWCDEKIPEQTRPSIQTNERLFTLRCLIWISLVFFHLLKKKQKITSFSEDFFFKTILLFEVLKPFRISLKLSRLFLNKLCGAKHIYSDWKLNNATPKMMYVVDNQLSFPSLLPYEYNHFYHVIIIVRWAQCDNAAERARALLFNGCYSDASHFIFHLFFIFGVIYSKLNDGSSLLMRFRRRCTCDARSARVLEAMLGGRIIRK